MSRSLVALSLCLLGVPLCSEPLSVTVLYDNVPLDPACTCSWGFSCLIRGAEHTILFDTGGDPQILARNMSRLGVDRREISLVVLSHSHGDHTGGLWYVLEAHEPLSVYLPPSFPPSFHRRIEELGHRVITADRAMELCPGVGVTGGMGTGTQEQALWVRTTAGVAVFTGCAHPGIVAVARRVSELTSSSVYLLLGGFHLSGASEAAIRAIARQLSQLGVRKVAPSHCTGDRAMSIFRECWGENYIGSGCGAVLALPGLRAGTR
jgi:7,8-dihydropterin-6-yl-methyl-4-(beta-D-ribofuranosyl)aminobenzene 5'-phosphate synthase